MSETPQGCAVIGLGLMGTSFALAWKAAGLAPPLIGYDHDRTACETARERCEMKLASSFEDLAPAELIVIAVPPYAVEEILRRLTPLVQPETLVTDLTSVKRPVMDAMREQLGGRCSYLGGHPMAGSQRSGAKWAEPDLFRGAPYVLTPSGERGRPQQAVTRFQPVVEAFGARPVVMTPGAHDRSVAWVSHLPQMVSYSLFASVDHVDQQQEILPLAGSGFQDMTRLAGSSPSLWRDVVWQNKESILDALKGFKAQVSRYIDVIEAEDDEALVQLMIQAQKGHQHWHGET